MVSLRLKHKNSCSMNSFLGRPKTHSGLGQALFALEGVLEGPHKGGASSRACSASLCRKFGIQIFLTLH